MHDREHGCPDRHVRQVAPARAEPRAEASRIEAPQDAGPGRPIDDLDEKVEQRYREQLVVERGRSGRAEQREQRKDAGAVEHSERQPARLGARRRGRIREQQVHAEEDGDGDRRFDEEVRAGRTQVGEAQRVRGGHGGQRHRGHPEQELHRERGQEDDQVDVGWEQLGGGDLDAVRDVGRARRQKDQRDDAQGERRRVEDVCAPAVLVPAKELLGAVPERHQEELQGKPLGPEPEEQVDAEDDRHRAEAERMAVAARPREQRLERVGEQELAGDQVREVVHVAPVPSPVREDGDLRQRLQVMLRAEGDVQPEGAAAGCDEDDQLPEQQAAARGEERPEQHGMGAGGRRPRPRDEEQGGHEGEDHRAARGQTHRPGRGIPATVRRSPARPPAPVSRHGLFFLDARPDDAAQTPRKTPRMASGTDGRTMAE